MGSGRTSGTGSGIRSPGAEPDRNLAGGQIDDARWNKKGRNLARAAFQESLMLALDDSKSANPGSDENSRSLGQLRRNGEPRLNDRVIRGGDCVVNKRVHLLAVVLIETHTRIEGDDLRIK